MESMYMNRNKMKKKNIKGSMKRNHSCISFGCLLSTRYMQNTKQI